MPVKKPRKIDPATIAAELDREGILPLPAQSRFDVDGRAYDLFTSPAVALEGFMERFGDVPSWYLIQATGYVLGPVNA